MIERSLQLDSNSSMNAIESRCATRPTDLPTENRRWARHGMLLNVLFFSTQNLLQDFVIDVNEMKYLSLRNEFCFYQSIS